MSWYVNDRFKNPLPVFALRDFLVIVLSELQVKKGRIFFHDILREMKIYKNQIAELRGRKDQGMWRRRPMKWDDAVNLVWYYLLEWEKKDYIIRHEGDEGTWWELNVEKIKNREAPRIFFMEYYGAVLKYKWPHLYKMIVQLTGE